MTGRLIQPKYSKTDLRSFANERKGRQGRTISSLGPQIPPRLPKLGYNLSSSHFRT